MEKQQRKAKAVKSVERNLFEVIDIFVERWQKRYPRNENSDEIIAEQDIIFDESQPEVCRLDTYHIPDRRRKQPVLFYIHGGGFVAGDKMFRNGSASWFAQRGLFVIVPNYGLCPEFCFPQPLAHLVAALDWVERNAETFNLDLEHVVVAGDSAGGYYSAMLMALMANPALAERLSLFPKIKFGAAILNCGVYDIAKLVESKVVLDMNWKIVHGFMGEKVDEFEKYRFSDACEPIPHINKDFPPHYVIYAEKDILCAGHADRYIEKLKEQGVYTEQYAATAFFSNHCFPFFWTGRDSVAANNASLAFIDRFLNGTLGAQDS